MWTQNQCILLLRETSTVDEPAVTGIGLMADADVASAANFYFDSSCGMCIAHDPNGFRVLVMPEKSLADLILYGYQAVDLRHYETAGLKYFSGIVYNTDNTDVIQFYRDLGFNCSKQSNKFSTLMSKNNRFTLLLNNTQKNNPVDVVFADTDDVFKTTSYYTVAGFDTKNYDLDKNSLDFGTNLNHKIIGYNCVAFGNAESYSIENSVKAPLLNIDLVFRTRKQYLHLEEKVVETHYGSA
jgi:hypothetical protein